MKRGPLTLEFTDDATGAVFEQVTLPAAMHRKLRRMARAVGMPPKQFIRRFVRRALRKPLHESMQLPPTRRAAASRGSQGASLRSALREAEA